MVKVASAGSATPLSPLTVADTATDLSGASVVSLTAVTVTAPVLAVCPAAMVSVFAFDSVKSPAPAFVPAEAATVSVTAALDARSSVAVTVAAPPFSEIDEDDSASVATGVASSSVRVSAAPATDPTPWLLDAVPVTVTLRSPMLSTSSSAAATVAVSVAFAVSPAAITMVASAPTV